MHKEGEGLYINKMLSSGLCTTCTFVTSSIGKKGKTGVRCNFVFSLVIYPHHNCAVTVSMTFYRFYYTFCGIVGGLMA